MSWTYYQDTGKTLSPTGKLYGYGFAGNGDGLNNPEKQAERSKGPLPVGTYDMTQWFERHESLGLGVIMLRQRASNEMFGRDGFAIHGYRNLVARGLKAFLESSDGCICIGDTNLRRQMWSSGDRVLEVKATEGTV